MTTQENPSEVPIEKVILNPDQPRKFFDPEKLAELKASIEQVGMINPLTVVEKDGSYILVAGERRLRAAQELGLSTVKVCFCAPDKCEEIAIVENLQREGLTVVEEAEAIKRLQGIKDYSNQDLADKLGKSPATISELLTISKITEEVRDQCRNDPKVPKYLLLEVAKSPRPKGQISKFKKLIEKGYTREEIRKSTRGPKKERALVLINNLILIRNKVQASDFAGWTADNKKDYKQELTSLKAALEESLATLDR